MKMKVVTTTLRQIRQHNPCSEGWRTLLSSLGKTEADDEPLPLTTIAGYDKEIIRFALACAQEVRHLMTDQRSLDVLSALERHLESPLSERELDKVLAAAWEAEVAEAAAWAAVEAARAAKWAAEAAVEAARAEARARQVQIFKGIFG